MIDCCPCCNGCGYNLGVWSMTGLLVWCRPCDGRGHLRFTNR